MKNEQGQTFEPHVEASHALSPNPSPKEWYVEYNYTLMDIAFLFQRITGR